jgi:hypothetical protein
LADWSHLWPDVGDENGVDAAQLHVDLEAEVGQRLRRGLVHILRLHNCVCKEGVKKRQEGCIGT